MRRALVFPLVLLVQLALQFFRALMPDAVQDEAETAIAEYYARDLDLSPRIYRAARRLNWFQREKVYEYIQEMLNEPVDEPNEIQEMRKILLNDN